MRTIPKSLVRPSFLLAAALALTFVRADAANITVSSGTTSIGTGGTATTNADIFTVDGGTLEVTSNSIIGGLSGTGGQISVGFQNANYSNAALSIDIATGESYSYSGSIRPNNYDGASVNALEIRKTGGGTQELAGVLTGYISSHATRPTLVVSGGTLKLSGAWGLDIYVDYAAAVAVNNGATLELSRSWEYGSGNTFNQLTNNARAILVNNGTLRFSGVNQFAGRCFTVGSGGATLSVASGISFDQYGINFITGSTGGNLTLAGESTDAKVNNAVGVAGTWGAGAKLIKAGSGTWTVAGVHQQMSGGVEVGAGTLVLTANSAYTATTAILNGGTLEVRSTLGGGSYAATISNDGSLVFNSTSAQTLGGVISGAGTFEIRGTGAVTLGAVNTYTGNTIVTAGTLHLGDVDAIKFSKLVTNASAGSVVFSVADGIYNIGALSGDGTIVLSDSASSPGAITLKTGNGDIAESFSGVLTGLGNLQKIGTDTLTLSGANTYAGKTIISSGRLALSGSGTLGAGIVQLGSGGTLDLSASTVAFTRSIELKGGQLTGGTMDVGQLASAQGGTITTVLTGSGGLTKTGDSTTLVLGAGVIHTYTGPTLVSAGKLKVDGTIDSSVTIANGALLGGHGTINGNVSLSSGSTVAAGGSVGNLTVGSLTIAAGAQITWDVYDASGVAGVDYDKITVDGAVDLSGLSSANKASLTLISLADPLDNSPGNAGFFDRSVNQTFTLLTYGSFLDMGSNANITSLFTIDSSSLRDAAGALVDGVFYLNDTGSSIDLVYISAVPEPSTYGLGLGFLSLAFVAVRRQRRKVPSQA